MIYYKLVCVTTIHVFFSCGIFLIAVFVLHLSHSKMPQSGTKAQKCKIGVKQIWSQLLSFTSFLAYLIVGGKLFTGGHAQLHRLHPHFFGHVRVLRNKRHFIFETWIYVFLYDEKQDGTLFQTINLLYWLILLKAMGSWSVSQLTLGEKFRPI